MIALKLAHQISVKGQSINSAQPLASVLISTTAPATGSK